MSLKTVNVALQSTDYSTALAATGLERLPMPQRMAMEALIDDANAVVKAQAEALNSNSMAFAELQKAYVDLVHGQDRNREKVRNYRLQLKGLLRAHKLLKLEHKALQDRLSRENNPTPKEFNVASVRLTFGESVSLDQRFLAGSGG